MTTELPVQDQEWVKIDNDFFYVKTAQGFDNLMQHETDYQTKYDQRSVISANNEGPQGYPTIVKVHRTYSENNKHWVLEPTFGPPLSYMLEQVRKVNLLIDLDPTLDSTGK